MAVPWMEILLFFLTGIASFIIFIKWSFGYWQRKNVPFLKPSFPMGNLEKPWAIKKGFHSTMVDIYKKFKAQGHKYGGIFSSLRPVFVPTDLELLKSIMIKDFQHFVDRGAYFNEKDDPLSAHLFSIEGDKWRSLRTRISPTFTSGKMKYMFQTVMECGSSLEAEIQKLYDRKKPVDVKEMGALFTTNVIGSCAFGLDCDAFANPNNEFRYHTRNFFKGGVARAVRNFATLSFPTLCKKLGVKVFSGDMTKFYYDVIKNVTELRESGEVKRNDFVQLLVNIKNGAKRSDESFTFDEIAAQAFVFFLAGFETSSSTMTFAFYEMAKNQEIQDKVRAEIRAVTAKYGGKMTYDAIMEMNYLGQVFDETLRKYPIVATLQRIVTKDYKLPGEELVLKTGTKVLISLLGIHHDPEYYPDPERFDPDRFSPENKLKRHVCAYMPFGEGPRICIGMRFGILQAKIGMAVMLKNYKYTLNSKMPEMKLYNKSLLLAPISDVPLDIEKVS